MSHQPPRVCILNILQTAYLLTKCDPYALGFLYSDSTFKFWQVSAAFQFFLPQYHILIEGESAGSRWHGAAGKNVILSSHRNTGVLATLFPIQLPANSTWEAVEDGTGT